MGFSTLFKSTTFTLKMYRLYWPYLLSISIMMPVTYLIIILAISQGDLEALRVALTGYITITGFNILLYMLATLIANTFEEQVLESYALLPVSFWEIVISQILAQALIGIIPLAVGLVVLKCISSNINIPLLITGLTLEFAIYTPLAILLGISVRNRIRLDPLLVFLMMFIVIATPSYYRLLYIGDIYKTLLLINPLTHVVLVLRSAVGVYEGFPLVFSIIYSILFSTLLCVLVLYKLRGGAFTVLEKR